ncbi:SH3 domain-containing protein [Mesorhizobium sp. AR07]|uniref:SH3 domain-containing protein n=1 Tax=Mesorhizobium sp. AR07 TaxID=2865838 RepID=UPI00215F4C4C|nr:SH3 domain-containing protein [Mesorhizobium sp. AR07]UVK46893.1 SH3 domain-containing protein [Mesorhizobium sp. AR07]
MMRRTVTLRTTLHALIAAPLLMAAWPAIAPATAEEAPDLVISIVIGLAPDDLLNVRTTASPIAKVETRLVGGESVTNLGCNDINGYKWCKIESTGKVKLSGWAPARYLIPLNPAPYVEGETKPADAPAVAANNEVAADTGGDAATQPPPDLTARLGGVAHPAASETPVKSAATTAMQDAYGLALAATETAPTGQIPDPVQDAAPAGDSGTATAQDAAQAGSIPVPTPRPEPAGAGPAVDTQTVAELPPQPTALAGGAVEIPCARYVGQPMAGCAANVVHTGAGKADVTVTWPDGGTRVISFSAGQPAGADAGGDFRFTREGSLNMIRIGVSERFEITDKLVLGD